MRALVLVAVAAAIGVVLWFALGQPDTRNQPKLTPPSTAIEVNATVVRVIDGDTIEVTFGEVTEPVRLIGVDTPETVDQRKPIQCFGPEASAHTKELLPEGTAIRLELDEEPRDRYGRLLAYVYRGLDGLFVNLELVDGGYGSFLVIEPNSIHAEQFRSAEATARQQGRGLWGTCGEPGLPAASSTTVVG